MATIGGLAMFRPAMRIGGPICGTLIWVWLEIIGHRLDDQESIKELKIRLSDPEEVRVDNAFMRIGGIFVASGTLLNAISGFFA